MAFAILRRHAMWDPRKVQGGVQHMHASDLRACYEFDMPVYLKMTILGAGKRDNLLSEDPDDDGIGYNELGPLRIKKLYPDMESFCPVVESRFGASARDRPQIPTHKVLEWITRAGWEMTNSASGQTSDGCTEVYMFQKK
mmetsp:Transcript_104140/g.294512  ORF Transcript_104140/g.294512 Transcript_104140/m.294512 type:complete len:140 (-) Transcript_104140:146-565(-)